MDDGSSPEITLSIQFIFFNSPYRSIYVSIHSKIWFICHKVDLNNSENMPVFPGEQQWRDLLQRAGQPVHAGGFSSEWQQVLHRSALGRRAQRYPWRCVLQGVDGTGNTAEGDTRHPEALQKHGCLHGNLGLHCHVASGHLLRRKPDDTGEFPVWHLRVNDSPKHSVCFNSFVNTVQTACFFCCKITGIFLFGSKGQHLPGCAHLRWHKVFLYVQLWRNLMEHRNSKWRRSFNRTWWNDSSGSPNNNLSSIR